MERWRSSRHWGQRVFYGLPRHQRSTRENPLLHISRSYQWVRNLQQRQFCCLFKIAHSKDVTRHCERPLFVARVDTAVRASPYLGGTAYRTGLKTSRPPH
jgi:hypothetical protein